MALLIGTFPVRPRNAPDLIMFVRAVVPRVDETDVVRCCRTALLAAEAMVRAHRLAPTKED